MTVYLDQATHRRLKSQLTRARNSKDPRKVLAAVESALTAWDGKAWPDDWHRWNIALGDAWQAHERSSWSCPGPDANGAQVARDVALASRFRSAFDQMA